MSRVTDPRMQKATARSNATVAECLAMGSHLQRLTCSVNHLYCREKYRPHHAAQQCCEEIMGSGSFVPPSEWELFASEFRGIATLIVGDSTLENKAQFLRALGVNNSCEGGGEHPGRPSLSLANAALLAATRCNRSPSTFPALGRQRDDASGFWAWLSGGSSQTILSPQALA